MGVVRLTERKLRDARFRKIEEAIFEAFFEGEGEMKLGVGELVQKIGVDRATFYRHHRAVCEIVEDYEEYILEKYAKLTQEIRGRGDVGVRRPYYEMLIFILRHKKIFKMLIGRGNLRVIGEMVGVLGLEMGLIGNSERVFRVYAGEVVGLITDWGLEGFKEVEIVILLNNIVYITDTARERLILLEN